MILQGHPRSLILAPIESAYVTCLSSLVTLVLYISPFQRYQSFSTRRKPFFPYPKTNPFSSQKSGCTFRSRSVLLESAGIEQPRLISDEIIFRQMTIPQRHSPWQTDRRLAIPRAPRI